MAYCLRGPEERRARAYRNACGHDGSMLRPPIGGRSSERSSLRAGPMAKALAISCALLLVAAGAVPAHTEQPELVPPPSRDVTPPGMTPGPKVTGPLYRIPTPPPPPEPPRWRRFFLPRTIDASTFVTKDNLTIRVYGITAPPLDETCRRADGEAWPCGRTALFSLRMFLHGRAVECLLPPLDDIERAVAPCRVGSTDLGEWLLRQGWATPDKNATEEYRTAAHDAHCDRLGIWRGTEPDPSCPAKPPEQTPAL